jgi:serine/threonine-protein kinase
VLLPLLEERIISGLIGLLQHISPTTGFWNGYADGNPNDEFFRITAYYFAYDVLTSICGDGDCGFDNGGFDRKAAEWFDNFNRTVPSWYLTDYAPVTLVKPSFEHKEQYEEIL